MTEYICSGCGNICCMTWDDCPVCGSNDIRRTVVSKSCLEYLFCTSRDCRFVSHDEVTVCPKCGRPLRRCCRMLPEDHWGLPIPPPDRCEGEIIDDDSGFEMAIRLLKR